MLSAMRNESQQQVTCLMSECDIIRCATETVGEFKQRTQTCCRMLVVTVVTVGNFLYGQIPRMFV
jgi:hypothetical protein